MKKIEDDLCALEADLIHLQHELDKGVLINLTGYDERLKEICSKIENHIFIEQPVGLLKRLETLLHQFDLLEEKLKQQKAER